MRITARVEGLNVALSQSGEVIAGAATASMREAIRGLKDDLRDQVRSAGLGQRLATTWQSAVYPKSGDSIDAAGQIWSKAPTIISAYAKGANIVPVSGQPYLAIPTDNVPRSRGRGSKKRMSVFEVETEFNQDLILRRGKRGSILGFVEVVSARSGRGVRQATKGRLKQGRASKLVLMFVFVRNARVPKLLDLDGAANRWAQAAGAALAARVGG